MNIKSLLGIITCTLILLPALSTPSIAKSATPFRTESDAELYVAICCGIPLITGTRGFVGVIDNLGDTYIYNVSYVFTITGGYLGYLNRTWIGNESKLYPKESSVLVWDPSMDTFGFGPVNITLIVSTSDTGKIVSAVKGFQIGMHTFVPFALPRALMIHLVELTHHVGW